MSRFDLQVVVEKQSSDNDRRASLLAYGGEWEQLKTKGLLRGLCGFVW